jgi:hypothetical protein
MDRRKLEAAATAYSSLKGLYAVPLGLIAIFAALANWGWGPLEHTWVFVAGVLLAAAACVPIRRYYNENYGRVTLSTRQQVRTALAVLVCAPLIFGGSFLVRSRVDWSLDLPLNPTAASLALLMLVCYAASVGLKAHQLIICGSLLVVGLLPVWHGGDPSNIGLVLGGLTFMLTGIFDHRLLVKKFGSPGGPSLEHGNAGA